MFCNLFPFTVIPLILVTLELLSGPGNPLDDATPIFISDSGSSISGLSNEVHNMSVVQEVSEKIVKTSD